MSAATVTEPPLDAQRVAEQAALRPRPLPMANPTPIALGLLAFALTVYGVRFINVDAATINGPTSYALDYALLIAGIAAVVGGVLAVVHGIAFRGWVTTFLGVWLIGFYLLITNQDEGAAQDPQIISAGPGGQPLPAAAVAKLAAVNVKAWQADSVAWYVWILIIPVVIFAAVVFIEKNLPFMVAFTAIVVLLVLLGSGFHEVYSTLTDVTRGRAAKPDLGLAVNLLKGSAWAALVGAAAIFWIFGKDVLRLSGASEHRATAHGKG